MSSDWPKVSISDVCELIVDCVNKTAPKVDYETPYKMIRTPNIRNGKITLKDCRFVTKDVFEKWTRRAKVLRGDVLLTREAPMGEVGYVDFDDQVFLGQRIMQYRADKEKLEPRFLLYSFLSKELQHQFWMHEGSGSVVSHIRVPDCSRFEVRLPPLNVQRKICNLLGAVDDKVQLNTQINQTLEQMAQALFKSWFVDFDPVIDNALEVGNPIPEPLAERAARRKSMWAAESEKAPARLPAETRRLFPDRFEGDEVLGWTPKGWKTKPLSQQITLIGGGTPKRSEKSFWDGDIPWFSVKDAPSESDVFVIDTEDKITQAGLKGSSAKLLPVGTTIITARGTVGKLAITVEEMAMNQSCYGVRPIKGLGNYYNFYNVKNAVVGLQQNVHGAVFDTITRQTFETVSSPLPNEDVVVEFESRVAVLMGKIKAALEENISLTQLRGTLLPKLLSGELQLPEAEAAVDTALETELA